DREPILVVGKGEREPALVAGPRLVHVGVVPGEVPNDLAPAEIDPQVAPARAVRAHRVPRSDVEGARCEAVRGRGQRADRTDLDGVAREGRPEVVAGGDGDLLRSATIEQ